MVSRMVSRGGAKLRNFSSKRWRQTRAHHRRPLQRIAAIARPKKSHGEIERQNDVRGGVVWSPYGFPCGLPCRLPYSLPLVSCMVSLMVSRMGSRMVSRIVSW